MHNANKIFIISRSRHRAPIINTSEILRENSKKEIMQKVVLFVEPIDVAFFTPTKIANLFINRFSIDEDASSEIVAIFELCKISWDALYPEARKYNFLVEERQQKGMNHFIVIQINIIRYKFLIQIYIFDSNMNHII